MFFVFPGAVDVVVLAILFLGVGKGCSTLSVWSGSFSNFPGMGFTTLCYCFGFAVHAWKVLLHTCAVCAQWRVSSSPSPLHMGQSLVVHCGKCFCLPGGLSSKGRRHGCLLKCVNKYIKAIIF